MHRLLQCQTTLCWQMDMYELYSQQILPWSVQFSVLVSVVLFVSCLTNYVEFISTIECRTSVGSQHRMTMTTLSVLHICHFNLRYAAVSHIKKQRR